MRQLLLSGLALVAAASGALAADLPFNAPLRPTMAPVATHTWTGFYVGAHAGYAWNDADMNLANVGIMVLPLDVQFGTLPRQVALDQDGFLGGVQAGYNLQFGAFVAGVEADVSWTDLDKDARYSAPDVVLFPGAITHTDARSKTEWLATLRGRAGVTFDRALFFVTGGVAAGEVTNSFSISIPTAPLPLGPYFSPKWQASDTQWGWVVGAGVEYALTSNISLKAEYLYYDLDDQTIHGTDAPNFGTEFIDYKFKNNGNIARAGVNWRF